MRRFKLSLAAAALAASASLAACGNDAPSGTAVNNSTANANANAAAQATPAANAAATPADQFAGARADYKQFCIKCHKEDGSGGPVELEDGQKIKVPNFRAEKHTDEQFVRKITNGDPDEGMPAFKNRLDAERIAALARLIRHEFQGQASAGGPNANAAAKSTPAAH